MQDWQYPALDFKIYSETEGLLCADAARNPKLRFVFCAWTLLLCYLTALHSVLHIEDSNIDIHNKLAIGAAAEHPLSHQDFIRLVSGHLRYDSVFVYWRL